MKRSSLRKHSKSKRSKLIKRADDAFSLWIRRRDGVCLYGNDTGDPCKGVLQCSHVKSKYTFPLLRYDPLNAKTLCERHHLYGWHLPDVVKSYKYLEWFKNKYPDRWEYLEQKESEYKLTPKHKIPDSFYEENITHFENLLKEDNNGKVRKSVTELVDFLNR